MKTPHAFAAAESRLDKEAQAARKREQREFDAAFVKTGLDGLLGAFTAERQAEILRHLIPQGMARYKALTDGPNMASLVGESCARLNPEIIGGKPNARANAEKLFKREGA